MKVNGLYQANLIKTYADVNKGNDKSKAAPKKDSDVVIISADARNIQSKAIEQSNDTDTARIEELRNRIKQGNYHPSSEAIARKMMNVIKGSEV